MVELIEGTALPVTVKQTADQPEGRRPTLHGQSPSLFEKIGNRDELAPHELAIAAAALRAWDRAPKKERTVFQQNSGATDATTGNLVLPLYQTPQGNEGHITNVTLDAPSGGAGGATINPSAPFANASSWAFLAIASPGLSGNGQADSLRPAMVAFAPSSAAGPIIPGQWTFNDSNAPVAFGGEMIYLVVHGGSIAAVKGILIVANLRVNLYSNAH